VPTKRSLALVPVVVVLASTPAFGQITYTLEPIVTPQGYTANGWIRTDGTLSELDVGNFQAWSITLDDGLGASLSLTESNSTVETNGVSASAKDLSFDGSTPNAFGDEEFDVEGPVGWTLDLEWGNDTEQTYSEFLRVDGTSDRRLRDLASLPNPTVFAVPEPTGPLLVLAGIAVLALRARDVRDRVP